MGLAEVVVKDAKVKCDQGSEEKKLKVNRSSITAEGKDVADVTAHIPFKDIPKCGDCKLTKPIPPAVGKAYPCTPITPSDWCDTCKHVKTAGNEILNKNAYCNCNRGKGKLTIENAGQKSVKAAN